VKTKNIAVILGVAIACFVFSFVVTIAYMWLCLEAVEHLGMIVSAAIFSGVYTVIALFRIFRS